MDSGSQVEKHVSSAENLYKSNHKNFVLYFNPYGISMQHCNNTSMHIKPIDSVYVYPATPKVVFIRKRENELIQ